MIFRGSAGGSAPRQARFPSRAAVLLLSLLFAYAVPAEADDTARTFSSGDTLHGRVVKVTDGDTLDVRGGDVIVTVRLHGIDAPESTQPYGAEATAAVREHAGGKRVTVRVTDVDRYGRAVGRVILPGGDELNRMLVARGLAWWYRSYAPDNRDLQRLERSAREAARGLWSHGDPTPPWEWRHGFEDRDCSDFDTQSEAQRFFESEGPGDRHRLDADGDGRACEGLP